MAAPVWVVGATVDQSGGGGVSFTKPASLANGDVVYILFYAWGNLLSVANKPGAPSGFTEVYWQVGAGTFLPSQAIYRKIITNAAGEPASYVVADPAGGYGSQDAQGGVIGRVTGADTTTPEDDSGATQGTANPADTGNVISTSQADALLLVICVNDVTAAPGTPTGMTVIFAGDGGDSVFYRQTLSAQVTNANRTSSLGATGHWTMGFVAIKPPAGGGGVSVTPGVGSLVLTGFIPKLDQGLTPGTGALVLSGFIPKLDTGLTPGKGSLVLNGFAPTVALSDNKSVVPTTGPLVLNGFAPTVAATANQFVTPSTGSLILTGFIPTVAAGGSQSVTPITGLLVLTGFAPTIATPQTFTPITAALLLAGFAPTITVAPLSTAVSGQFMLLGMG